VRGRLNSVLRGWSSYFSYGTRLMAYRAIDNHVYDCVRRDAKAIQSEFAANGGLETVRASDFDNLTLCSLLKVDG
jgi:hypothetical protein